MADIKTKDQLSAKNNIKAVPDKNNSAALTKVKKSSVQFGQPKKRRFAFVIDIYNELKKVIWPTRQETIRLTLIVIGICLIMALILGLLDFGFAELVAKVFLGGK